MVIRHDLTRDQIIELIVLRFTVGSRRNDRMMAIVAGQSGEDQPSHDERIAELIAQCKTLLNSEMAAIIADRLLLDDRDLPLFQIGDVSAAYRVISTKLDQIDSELAEFLVENLPIILEAAMKGLKKPENEPADYDKTWDWINATLEVATSNSVTPQQVIEQEPLFDEVIRRTSSPQTYLDNLEVVKQFLTSDPEALIRQTVIQSMVNEGTPQDEAEQEFNDFLNSDDGREAVAEARALFERGRDLVELAAREDIERIWPEMAKIH